MTTKTKTNQGLTACQRRRLLRNKAVLLEWYSCVKEGWARLAARDYITDKYKISVSTFYNIVRDK